MFLKNAVSIGQARATSIFSQCQRSFARLTGRPGKLQHFRYGVSKVRGRWYYRYHKPIGRANWKAYQERYIRPKDVEAKQRLVFAPKATTRQLKQSISWQWRLPKMLAAATTPNQVLDAWILFRYRHPKKIYHYMSTLRRLVEVGGCSASDWRLSVIISRMRKVYKRVTSIDLLMKYFSSLGLHSEIEYLTRFLLPRIPYLKPEQHLSILNSFGVSQLRDTQVAGLLTRHLRRNIENMSNADKISSIEALGKSDIRDSVFVTKMAHSIISADTRVSVKEFRRLIPALGHCRVRDFVVAELAVDRCLLAIQQQQTSSYGDICHIMKELTNQGILETQLAAAIVENVPPVCISTDELIAGITGSMSLVDADILNIWMIVLRNSICLINDPVALVEAVRAVDFLYDSIPDADTFLESTSSQFSDVSNRMKQPYNAATLADIFARRRIYASPVWDRIARELPKVIENFEPEDLMLLADTIFTNIPEGAIKNDTKIQISNEVALWSAKRRAEFKKSQWTKISTLIHQSECNPKLKSNIASQNKF